MFLEVSHWKRNVSKAALSFFTIKICFSITGTFSPVTIFQCLFFRADKFLVILVTRQMPLGTFWLLPLHLGPFQLFAHKMWECRFYQFQYIPAATAPHHKNCRLIISIRRQTCFWCGSISGNNGHFIYFSIGLKGLASLPPSFCLFLKSCSRQIPDLVICLFSIFNFIFSVASNLIFFLALFCFFFSSSTIVLILFTWFWLNNPEFLSNFLFGLIIFNYSTTSFSGAGRVSVSRFNNWRWGVTFACLSGNEMCIGIKKWRCSKNILIL